MDYDAIVIGTGNAGMAAAGELAKHGRKVAIVESGEVGGTCALRGCVPKKVLVAAAETLDAIARASGHCIEVGHVRLDWRGLIERELSFVEGVPAEMEASLARRGIDVLHGRAVFCGRTGVAVGGRALIARDVVVATGSTPRSLPFDGAEHLVTSDRFLRTTTLPKTAAFVGAGVIALELAHVLARAGTAVTLLEVLSRPLSQFDEDIVARLVEHSRELGVRLVTSARVETVARRGDGFVVTYTHERDHVELEVETVIHGAGRVAALDGLQLGAADVAFENGAPMLDPFLRSRTNPSVWFAGDARGPGPQLSPVATYEGKIVAHNILHRDTRRSPDYSCVPSCVFTIPALASVGRTVQQARDAGLDFDVRENEMRSWRSARTYVEPQAYSKVLVERGSSRILGAHLVGHGAQETVHAFALAMRHGLHAVALGEMVYAYPTFHADLRHQL